MAAIGTREPLRRFTAWINSQSGLIVIGYRHGRQRKLHMRCAFTVDVRHSSTWDSKGLCRHNAAARCWSGFLTALFMPHKGWPGSSSFSNVGWTLLGCCWAARSRPLLTSSMMADSASFGSFAPRRLPVKLVAIFWRLISCSGHRWF
jgi:hypothetical protein